MKTLLEYIEQLKDTQNIRIKLACDCDDTMMDRIEKHLEKYDVESVSMPTKTILQRRPLDFPQLDMAEVYIIDFTANLPVSTEMLRQELVKLLDISEAHINVRRADEPREQELEQQDQKEDHEYQPIMGREYTKEEGTGVKAEELYGDKYNTGFLKELKKLRDERKKQQNTPKIKDPDVPASDPELGDGKMTNKVSPISGKVKQ